MKILVATIVFCLAGSFATHAQASLAKLKNAPLHAGDSRSFEAPFKKLVAYSRDAMVDAGLELESTEKIDDRTYMMIGKTRASGFSWGEMVRVTVIMDDDNSNKSTVRVYTKKRVKINITAKGSYSNTIFSNIETKVEFGE